jgi:hypothetical protein
VLPLVLDRNVLQIPPCTRHGFMSAVCQFFGHGLVFFKKALLRRPIPAVYPPSRPKHITSFDFEALADAPVLP